MDVRVGVKAISRIERVDLLNRGSPFSTWIQKRRLKIEVSIVLAVNRFILFVKSQ